jgi:amino-acid N-acetyltransferase
MTRSALALARRQGITHVYLLTETAANFFPKFGFRQVDRSQVPPAVQTSIEFTTLCPASALAMELRLEQADAATE